MSTKSLISAVLAGGAAAVLLWLVVLPGSTAAYTISSIISPGCHEDLTSEALRAVRVDLPTAAPLPVTAEDLALVNDVLARAVEEGAHDRADDQGHADDHRRVLQLEARIDEVVLDAPLVFHGPRCCGGGRRCRGGHGVTSSVSGVNGMVSRPQKLAAFWAKVSMAAAAVAAMSVSSADLSPGRMPGMSFHLSNIPCMALLG